MESTSAGVSFFGCAFASCTPMTSEGADFLGSSLLGEIGVLLVVMPM